MKDEDLKEMLLEEKFVRMSVLAGIDEGIGEKALKTKKAAETVKALDSLASSNPSPSLINKTLAKMGWKDTDLVGGEYAIINRIVKKLKDKYMPEKEGHGEETK